MPLHCLTSSSAGESFCGRSESSTVECVGETRDLQHSERLEGSLYLWKGVCTSLCQQSLARHLVTTSRWHPDYTLLLETTTPWPTGCISASVSAKPYVVSSADVKGGRWWFWLWAVKVFSCWNWLVERNQRSCVECSRPPACGIFLLMQSCTCQVSRDNIVVEAQIYPWGQVIGL